MARNASKKGLPFGVLILVAMAYIGFGDAFLPGEAGRFSYQTRAQINRWMINVFPGFKVKTNPHQRTEQAIEREEKSK
jgi:hypothetical protein